VSDPVTASERVNYKVIESVGKLFRKTLFRNMDLFLLQVERRKEGTKSVDSFSHYPFQTKNEDRLTLRNLMGFLTREVGQFRNFCQATQSSEGRFSCWVFILFHPNRPNKSPKLQVITSAAPSILFERIHSLVSV
jgi:hypothetical protein